MFTPSKKKQSVPDWSIKPHNRNFPFAADKGKSIASSMHIDREAEDWRRLKESGVLSDESLFEKQDREALVKRVSDLEHELRGYQHNMGLLLMEKRNCDSTCEELREALSQARESLKREKIANIMALAEVEKREENWRKALENKQCVANVEVQTLYDEHNTVLESKRREFELEMNQKRKAIDEKEEALKQEKENLERGWKKAEIANMLNQLKEEKEKFEKLKSSNEERLKNENLIAQEYIQKQLEALRMKKASFEASMERERLLASEKARSERKKMLHDLEQQKRELELDMQNKLEKLEQAFLEKEKVMKEKYEVAVKNTNQSREHEKIDALVKNLKDQTKGDTIFLKKLEKCENCGEVISDFALAVLRFLEEMRNTEGITDVSVEHKGEVPEASLPTESKNVKPKRVIKPRRGANSVKEEAGDAKATVRKTQCTTVLKQPSGLTHEVPEASLNLETKNDQLKCDLKPKRGARRANTAKKEAEDAKLTAETAQDPMEGMQPSGITDLNADNNEAPKLDSVCVDKGSVAVVGKRLRSNPSEEENDNHEAHSVCIAAGGSKKRRQTVDRGSQIPAVTRYSLRQRKT